MPSRLGPLALAAVVAALAGCQPLPRPFAPPDSAAVNPLLTVKDGLGVAVLDLAGAPGPTARALTDALIDALLERDIPAAFSAGNRRSAFAYGEATASPASGGRLDVEMVWNLVDPEARPLGRHRTRARPTERDWASGAPAMVKTLAGSAADGIAALIRGEDRAGPSAATARARPAIFLPRIATPAMLDESVLRRALGEALPAGDLGLAERRAGADLVLEGTITLGPAIGARRRLGLIWRLADSRGREIGRLDQANDVEIDVLQTGWPALARVIAQALVPELRAMIASAARPSSDTVYRIPGR